MSVEEIQQEIAKLTVEDQSKLRVFLAGLAADAFDQRLAADSQSGRLDHLLQEAEGEYQAGMTRPLDEILHDS